MRKSQSEYYQANRERIREYGRAKYAANPEPFKQRERERRLRKLTEDPEGVKRKNREVYESRKSEVLRRQKDHYQANREEIISVRKNNYAADPRNKMISASRARAKAIGVPHSITVRDVIIPRVCPVLGIPLAVTSGANGRSSPSLDRIIPELGYVPGNVMVVSWRANDLKGNATIAELQSLARFYSRYMESST